MIFNLHLFANRYGFLNPECLAVGFYLMLFSFSSFYNCNPYLCYCLVVLHLIEKFVHMVFFVVFRFIQNDPRGLLLNVAWWHIIFLYIPLWLHIEWDSTWRLTFDISFWSLNQRHSKVLENGCWVTCVRFCSWPRSDYMLLHWMFKPPSVLNAAKYVLNICFYFCI